MIQINSQQWYNDTIGDQFYMVESWCRVIKEWLDDTKFFEFEKAKEYCKNQKGIYRVVSCGVIFETTDKMPEKYQPKVSVMEDSLIDKINESLKNTDSIPTETVVYIS